MAYETVRSGSRCRRDLWAIVVSTPSCNRSDDETHLSLLLHLLSLGLLNLDLGLLSGCDDGLLGGVGGESLDLCDLCDDGGSDRGGSGLDGGRGSSDDGLLVGEHSGGSVRCVSEEGLVRLLSRGEGVLEQRSVYRSTLPSASFKDVAESRDALSELASLMARVSAVASPSLTSAATL